MQVGAPIRHSVGVVGAPLEYTVGASRCSTGHSVGVVGAPLDIPSVYSVVSFSVFTPTLHIPSGVVSTAVAITLAIKLLKK